MRQRLIRLCRFSYLAVGLALVGAGLALAGCTTNPATGRTSFTAFMSKDKEVEVGREEHPKIVKEFGGEYPDPKIRQYVQQLGERLARNSELPDLKFTFTVLNSDIVNAFALPGGYVYVTRGLMALASSEAELAGVLGHEIGHITSRHTAERYSAAMGAGIFATALGIFLGGPAGQLGEAAAGMALASYSRDQELEADMLGVRYLDRTGYDENAMASFLGKMQAESRLSAELAGRPGAGDEFSIMQTHPRTADRVREAIDAARKQGSVGNPDARVAKDAYFDAIDGLTYGGDRENGWVINRQFVHPALRIRFEVPQGFRLMNSETKVIARGPNNARIIFDRAPRDRDGRSAADGVAPADYIRRVWARNLTLSNVETININGLEAATAAGRMSTSSGAMDVRLVAIRFDPRTMYRFIFATQPAQTAALSEPLRRTTYSFRRLDDREAANARPPRLRVVRVAAGDTAESLARRMPFDEFGAARFRVLNGLGEGQQPQPGDRVKIVVAE
jgi:predicted Zn-dependent protease